MMGKGAKDITWSLQPTIECHPDSLGAQFPRHIAIPRPLSGYEAGNEAACSLIGLRLCDRHHIRSNASLCPHWFFVMNTG